MLAGNIRKLLFLLSLPAFVWTPGAIAGETGEPDFAPYVYLHLTRGAAELPAGSCRGRIQAIRL